MEPLPPSLLRALPLFKDAVQVRADAGALLAPTDAGGFRVFLDDTCAMPADWRARLYVRKNVSCRTCPEDDKYGAESALPHMIAASPFATDDWRRANASLVVLYNHRYGGPLLALERCRRRLVQHSAAWRATGGKQHFFVATSDFGPCDHNGHLLFPSLLGHHIIATHGEMDGHHWHWGVGPNLPCFSERKDVSIPPSNWLESPVRTGSGVAAKRKELLAFFAGAGEFRNGRRQGRQSMLRYWGNHSEPSILAVPKVPRDELRRGMERARYCPIFGGNSPWSTRLVEAINCHCVPVFFSSWRPPFSRMLDWDRFSVRIPSLDQVPMLKDILEAQPYDQLAANLPLVRDALWYRVRGGYRGDDVLPFVLTEMQMALRAAVQQPLSSLAEEIIGVPLELASFDDDIRNNRSGTPRPSQDGRLPPHITHAIRRAHTAFSPNYRGGVTVVTNRSSVPGAGAVVWRCVPISTHGHSYRANDPLDVSLNDPAIDEDLARLIMANCMVIYPRQMSLSREKLEQLDPLSPTQTPPNYTIVRENRAHFLRCHGWCSR